MFGRLVTIKLKVDSADELIRINKKTIVPLLRAQKGFRDESLYIAPCGLQAIAKTTGQRKRMPSLTIVFATPKSGWSLQVSSKASL